MPLALAGVAPGWGASTAAGAACGAATAGNHNRRSLYRRRGRLPRLRALDSGATRSQETGQGAYDTRCLIHRRTVTHRFSRSPASDQAILRPGRSSEVYGASGHAPLRCRVCVPSPSAPQFHHVCGGFSSEHLYPAGALASRIAARHRRTPSSYDVLRRGPISCCNALSSINTGSVNK